MRRRYRELRLAVAMTLSRSPAGAGREGACRVGGAKMSARGVTLRKLDVSGLKCKVTRLRAESPALAPRADAWHGPARG